MKFVKSFFILLLTGVIVFSAAGCGTQKQSQSQNQASAQTPAQTPGQNPSQSPAQNSPKNVIKLKSSIQAPPSSPLSKGFDAYLNEIEKKSNGVVKFERFYSESLAKAADQLNAVSAGIADIAVVFPSYVPGKLPLANVTSNPMLWKDSWVGAMAINELYQTIPELQKELEQNGVKFVGQFASPSYYIISSKPVTKLENVAGLKSIATGQLGVLAKEMKANPVGIPITDAYEALQRGTIDSVFYGVTAATSYGLEQSAKYIWKMPVGGSAALMTINLKVWNQMPQDLQAVFNDVAKNVNPKDYHTIYQIEGDEQSFKKFQAAGTKIVEPSPEDVQKVKAIADEKVWVKWVADQQAKGLPGKKVLETFQQLIEKYNKENPFAK